MMGLLSRWFGRSDQADPDAPRYAREPRLDVAEPPRLNFQTTPTQEEAIFELVQLTRSDRSKVLRACVEIAAPILREHPGLAALLQPK